MVEQVIEERREKNVAPRVAHDVALPQDPLTTAFPPHLELIPQLNEVYELRLAAVEVQQLSDEDLVKRSAYFQSVRGRPTLHYLMCSGNPLLVTTSGERRRQFFAAHQFKTGYATHGFFPYRGKFHPQMIKGILNAMKLKPGETVLDPMMGSGTTIVEAATMGINAIGVDVNPFCAFMAQTKADALAISPEKLLSVVNNRKTASRLFSELEAGLPANTKASLVPPRRIAALAYLDAIGYAARSSRLSPEDAFAQILAKYTDSIAKFHSFREAEGLQLGDTKASTGDARHLDLEPDSVDGILFSPPYSFAVDYVANDEQQLRMMGVPIAELRERMVGLRGRKGVEQVLQYRDDVAAVLSECARVLRPGRSCVVVVGTNANQLNALRRRDGLQDLEPSLEEMFVGLGSTVGLAHTTEIRRQVHGIANSLREESILFFTKTKPIRAVRGG